MIDEPLITHYHPQRHRPDRLPPPTEMLPARVSVRQVLHSNVLFARPDGSPWVTPLPEGLQEANYTRADAMTAAIVNLVLISATTSLDRAQALARDALKSLEVEP